MSGKSVLHSIIIYTRVSPMSPLPLGTVNPIVLHTCFFSFAYVPWSTKDNVESFAKTANLSILMTRTVTFQPCGYSFPHGVLDVKFILEHTRFNVLLYKAIRDALCDE